MGVNERLWTGDSGVFEAEPLEEAKSVTSCFMFLSVSMVMCFETNDGGSGERAAVDHGEDEMRRNKRPES
jgi:hypothetical protein